MINKTIESLSLLSFYEDEKSLEISILFKYRILIKTILLEIVDLISKFLFRKIF